MLSNLLRCHDGLLPDADGLILPQIQFVMYKVPLAGKYIVRREIKY